MPKKFNFKLETLLRVRVLEEEKCKRNFAKVMGRFTKKKEELDKIDKELSLALITLKDLSSQSTVDINKVKKAREYIDYLHLQRANLTRELEEIQYELEQKREELMEASKRKKMVENLKEKKFKEYIYEINKDEQKTLDEIGIHPSFKKVKAGGE